MGRSAPWRGRLVLLSRRPAPSKERSERSWAPAAPRPEAAPPGPRGLLDHCGPPGRPPGPIRTARSALHVRTARRTTPRPARFMRAARAMRSARPVLGARPRALPLRHPPPSSAFFAPLPAFRLGVLSPPPPPRTGSSAPRHAAAPGPSPRPGRDRGDAGPALQCPRERTDAQCDQMRTSVVPALRGRCRPQRTRRSIGLRSATGGKRGRPASGSTGRRVSRVRTRARSASATMPRQVSRRWGEDDGS